MSEELTAPETGAEALAPAPVEAVTPEAPEAASAEAPLENKAKERLSLRFSELTSQRESAREEARRSAEEAAYWRSLATSRTHEPEPSHEYDPGNPASIEAAVERAVEARLQKEAEAKAQNAQRETVQTMRTKLLESGLDGAALIASGADVPFTQAMFDALTVSEQPAVLADFLGRNLSEAARIAGMPPVQQGFELARLETRLASQPRTTNALPPLPTVGGRAVSDADPTSMTFEQYKAARESGKI